ncbi:uncharacterized protein E0L32_000214 [Thyridium curvatum]|uniref:Uncharacterized protein n=1 Tax=Thyridium curvatum TaxID=1093900 RepID=A0A507BH56_9PEZI|nr:uncharacterized protein E0L32_000214 [Thyridium curvatum]TPX15880.1 hypothetical protein E0L32_000214 [Thyridium curvatum]
MKEEQPVGSSDEKQDGEASMKEVWAEAAKAFETICGESLQKGEVKTFDDVQKRIESSGKATFESEPQDKWDTAKGLGLKSLKYLKMLVGAASQASQFIPIPAEAVSITGSALGFVFDIPQAIKGYNDAINEVFGEVAPALSQFQIYRSIDNVDPLLVRQIHTVLVSFVKVCAHVVKYRQGRKRDRFLQQVKSVFENDSGLSAEMAQFKKALQWQRDVEGTITLAVVVETRQDMMLLLERFSDLSRANEETQQTVQEMHKGVQALKDDSDRTKTLVKIRDGLGVPSTVRLDTNTTQTCINVLDRCLDGTGSWIWTHDAYTSWIGPKEKGNSHVLFVTGSPSSGKTSVSALITKRLQEQKGRTYSAHYFFPASIKNDDYEQNAVLTALKYMAFQIARVDATVQKALGKACDAGPLAIRRSTSSETLDALWGELKIGVPGSGATYYLVFDGLENVPKKQAESLLKFVFGPRLSGDPSRRVRILLSGTDEQYPTSSAGTMPLRIQMEDFNGLDMRTVIDEALSKRSMLQNAKTNSDQQKAKDKILEKLPRNVNGSYSMLQFGLDRVIRSLSSRTAVQELDRILDQSMSSHEAAINNLQRSLTAEEIAELNELLKWVVYGHDYLTLDQLEAVMWLYSGIVSLTPLEYIITNKYSAVLKLENGFVYFQDGALEYLQTKKESANRASDRATISMTITINNVEREQCRHFLWDLAHMAIRDNFNFNADSSNVLQGGGIHDTISVDEFDAHHTMVTRTFEYLNNEPTDQTKEIGKYLIAWLPYHLAQLRQLEDEDKGMLMPHDQFKIGQDLYKLFRDDRVIKNHRATFQETYWTVDEMNDMQKWLMDSAIVRKLDKKWRSNVQLAANPTRGYLKEIVKMVVTGLLRDRSWDVANAALWLKEFMAVDEGPVAEPEVSTAVENEDAASSAESFSGNNASSDCIDWERAATWCQAVLGLADSDLDSLWYERLAESSFTQGVDLHVTLSFYERAVAQKNPSWRCHRGYGFAYYRQGASYAKASAEVERALEQAQGQEANPKPEAKDIVELHLLLGNIYLDSREYTSAAEHFGIACSAEDAEQALEGQIGQLRAKMFAPDSKDAAKAIKATLGEDDGLERMARVLKHIARDLDHSEIVSKLFTMGKKDPEILEGIAQALRTATAKLEPVDEKNNNDARFEEEETRGVLLYDLGVAAYTYKASADGTEPISEAIRLWNECRDQLANVGGAASSWARRNATTALAKHYFVSMLDENHWDHLEALKRLAEEDGMYNEPQGFLGALYALRGDKEQARAALMQQFRTALNILSDDTPDNDSLGYQILLRTMLHYQDFKNVPIALSLFGQTDLISEQLTWEMRDIETNVRAKDKQEIFDITIKTIKLSEDIIRVTKAQVPDAARQVERIKAAIKYTESLAGADQTPIKEKVESAGIESHPENLVIIDTGGPDDLSTQHMAINLILSRLKMFERWHVPELRLGFLHGYQKCDGCTDTGERCDRTADCETGLYHCTYCSQKDFCADCLARLRDPTSDLIKVCDPRHRWLLLPPLAADVYVGPGASRVRVAKCVEAVNGDEQILQARFAEDGSGEEISVEAWKESLAAEWGLSIEEIRNDLSRQATPEENEGDGEA